MAALPIRAGGVEDVDMSMADGSTEVVESGMDIGAGGIESVVMFVELTHVLETSDGQWTAADGFAGQRGALGTSDVQRTAGDTFARHLVGSLDRRETVADALADLECALGASDTQRTAGCMVVADDCVVVGVGCMLRTSEAQWTAGDAFVGMAHTPGRTLGVSDTQRTRGKTFAAPARTLGAPDTQQTAGKTFAVQTTCAHARTVGSTVVVLPGPGVRIWGQDWDVFVASSHVCDRLEGFGGRRGRVSGASNAANTWAARAAVRVVVVLLGSRGCVWVCG